MQTEDFLNKIITLPTHFPEPVQIESITLQKVELDGPLGLSSGRNPLLEKEKDRYPLRDIAQRGEEEEPGIHGAPVIDILHRLLWLLEHEAYNIPSFLESSRPNYELLHLAAQALTGTALGGSQELIATTSAEKSLAGKLLQNWENLIGAKPLFTGKIQ